jgi:hypothetical protein
MCGILAALGVTGDAEANRRDILKLSKLLRHRGPDASGIYEAPDGKAFIAFERLSIVDPSPCGKYVHVIRVRDIFAVVSIALFMVHCPCLSPRRIP